MKKGINEKTWVFSVIKECDTERLRHLMHIFQGTCLATQGDRTCDSYQENGQNPEGFEDEKLRVKE